MLSVFSFIFWTACLMSVKLPAFKIIFVSLDGIPLIRDSSPALVAIVVATFSGTSCSR